MAFVGTRRARARRNDAGFTIIELTVAMGLLAIVAASLAGVFWAAVKTAGIAAHRSDATSIASREIESMRAVPYTSLGFYMDQTGYASNFPGGKWTDPQDHKTYDVVTLGSMTPSDADGPIPSQIQIVRPDANASLTFAPDPDPNNANPIVQGSVSYSVQRFVVWVGARDASTTYTDAYKRTTVIVSWSDRAGPHTARQDSIVYPGGQGQYNGPEGAGPSTTSSTTPVLQPNAPTLTGIQAPAQFQINVTWTASATGPQPTNFVVQWATDSGFTTAVGTSPQQPSNATSYLITGLAPSTNYYVEVFAFVNGTSSVASNVLQIQTQSQGGGCVLGPLSVSGATSKSTTGTVLQKSGKMSENLLLSWTTSGSCNDTYNVTAVNSSGQADPSSPYTLTTSVAGNYSGTVLSANVKGWGTGVHTFTVYDITKAQATAAVKTFKVCVFGAKSC